MTDRDKREQNILRGTLEKIWKNKVKVTNHQEKRRSIWNK